MRRRMCFLWTSGLFVLFIFFFAGCAKDEKDKDVYLESGRDATAADFAYSDVFNQIDLATRQLEDQLAGTLDKVSPDDGGCATITIAPFDTINWPKTITADFGATNCQGVDGKYRRGVLIATITGWYRDSLTVVTITPQDFYVNDYKVEGTKTVTNMGRINGGHLTFGIEIQDGVITRQDGSQFRYVSTRTRVWIEGEFTAWPSVNDDVFELTGYADCIMPDEISVHIETASALRIERDCEWIVSGSLEVTPEGLVPRKLDYGEGDCDNEAILTIGSKSYRITLP